MVSGFIKQLLRQPQLLHSPILLLHFRRSLLVAAYAVGVAFVVLFFFIVAGQLLLEALKIPMASFQLAGSLVLLLFGLKLVLCQVSEEAAAVSPDAT